MLLLFKIKLPTKKTIIGFIEKPSKSTHPELRISYSGVCLLPELMEPDGTLHMELKDIKTDI